MPPQEGAKKAHSASQQLAQGQHVNASMSAMWQAGRLARTTLNVSQSDLSGPSATFS
jgi:hypothetical protein